MTILCMGSRTLQSGAIASGGHGVTGWSGLALMCAVAVVLALSTAKLVNAAQPGWKTVFERAEFVLSKESRPPSDAAAWEAVALPDEWRRRLAPDIRGQGWYRFKFQLPQAPAAVNALNIPHRRSLRTDFFVNGSLVGGSRDSTAWSLTGAFQTPIYITVPPSLLHAGENVIHVRVHATSARMDMHGLAPVTFGDAREVRKIYIASNDVGFQAQRAFFAMAFAAGLIAIFLWFARRSDRVILWFGIACLSWGVVSIPRMALRWMDLPGLINVLVVFMDYGLVVSTVILCLRIVNLRWPRIEAALWAYLIVEVTYPLWWSGSGSTISLVWDAANTAMLLFGIAIILAYSKAELRWSEKVEVIALLLMAALMFSEVMRYLGWIPVDTKVLRHYHVPLLVFAIGAAIFEQHVAAVWRMEQTTADLERRVAEKAREIEANHARVEEARREQGLASERQRILADMHDGVGASLIGLLRYVQSGGADRVTIEQRVQESLQEMRIAIDAMQPREGDLAAVLGSLRYRLDDMIRATGVGLTWDVEELPTVEGLKPSTVFALQRLLLEAIANALKHSGARRLHLTARAQRDSAVEIRVEDDGRGFDPSQPAVGLGLANMRARAERIGARLDILSRAGEGTVVQLLIPRTLSAPVERSVPAQLEPLAQQGLVPAHGMAA